MTSYIPTNEPQPQEVTNWNALQTDCSTTPSGSIGWFLLRLAAVIFCAIVLYLFGGLGAGMAVLVGGWFVLYKG
jgi:hypothetical protein